MNKGSLKLGLLVGTWLTAASLSASPLTGEYLDKNSHGVESTYKLSQHPNTVFVFHHFNVEVC